MPLPALKALAKKHGLDLSTVERYWQECKASAGEDNYAAVMGCVKKRIADKKKGSAGRGLMAKFSKEKR